MKHYTVDGEFGDIRYLTNFKNELFGFQDKGVFNILYNQRAMINTDIGQEVMLGSTGTVQGVKYLTKKSGAINKWSIVDDGNNLFYIDTINNGLMVLSENPHSLSSQLG